jgi:hypothetical protein
MSLWANILSTAGTNKKYTQNVDSKTKRKGIVNIRKDLKNIEIKLTRNGVLISIHVLQDLDIHRKIINKFTVNIPTLMGYDIKVPNHTQDMNIMKYIFPRFGFLDYMYENFKNYSFVNKIGRGKIPSIPYKWTGQFSNNQPLIAEHIMKNYFNKEMVDAGRAGLILNLEAGHGKTFLASGLIEKIQRKTLIVVHNKTIMYQWIKVLKAAYPKNTIASFFGEKKEYGDIVVGIINTLVMQEPKFFHKFGYVILDEIHTYVSKMRKKIYSLASSTYMLGLSATPEERTDGLDVINTWWCGPILKAVELPGYNVDDIPFKGIVNMIKYVGPQKYTKTITNPTLDIVSFSQMVSQMCEDPYRIHVIIKLIYELRQKDMQVLVFADRRSYLDEIRKELERFKIQTDILDDMELDAKRLVGGAKATEIEYAAKFSNVILSTFAFMGTGVSIPKLNAIVLCSPRKRGSKQFIGRIFRLGSDYSIVRQIFDVVDFGSVLKSSWYIRKAYYKSMEYPITETKVNYKDVESEMLDMGVLVEEDSDGNEVDVVNKSLKELELLLEKNKIIKLDLEDLELLSGYSSCDYNEGDEN